MKLVHKKGTNFFSLNVFGTFEQKLNSVFKWSKSKNKYDSTKNKIKNFIKSHSKEIKDVVIIQRWNRKSNTQYTSAYYNDLINDPDLLDQLDLDEETISSISSGKITQDNLIKIAIASTLQRSYDYEDNYDEDKPHPLRSIIFKFIY
jgi:hypothetical protein